MTTTPWHLDENLAGRYADVWNTLTTQDLPPDELPLTA